MSAAISANGTVVVEKTGTPPEKTAAGMPPVFHDYLYENNQNSLYLLIEDLSSQRKIVHWIGSVNIDLLRRLESSLNAEQRRRFHLALVWAMGAEESLRIIWSTTVYRMMGSATLPKVEELFQPYRKDEEDILQCIKRVLACYEDMLKTQNEIDLGENDDNDNGERQDLEDLRAELEQTQENLSRRISLWNEQRKEVEAQADCREQLAELRSRCSQLEKENAVLRQTLKTIL